MQIRWTNIIALGAIAFAVTLAIKLGPWLREFLVSDALRMAPRSTEERLFALCVLGLLILGVVTVLKIIVRRNRRDN